MSYCHCQRNVAITTIMDNNNFTGDHLTKTNR